MTGALIGRAMIVVALVLLALSVVLSIQGTPESMLVPVGLALNVAGVILSPLEITEIAQGVN